MGPSQDQISSRPRILCSLCLVSFTAGTLAFLPRHSSCCFVVGFERAPWIWGLHLLVPTCGDLTTMLASHSWCPCFL